MANELSPRKIRTTIVDPDLGELELEYTPPTRQEWDEAVKQMESNRQPHFPLGSVNPCPSCKKNTLIGRVDLSHEVIQTGRTLVYRNLRGARCESCGAQILEPAEFIAIEDDAGLPTLADYEVKVSNIGSGTIGTYWPKDVVRVLRLAPQRSMFLKILDADTAMIRVDRRTPKATPRARPARSAARSKR